MRPGGYWILSGPPIRWKKYWRGWARTQEDLKQEQDSIEEVARRLCWKKVVEKNDLAIWQKPLNHIQCIKNKKVYKTPHICKSDDPDSAWYVLVKNISNHVFNHSRSINEYLIRTSLAPKLIKVPKLGDLHNSITRGKWRQRSCRWCGGELAKPRIRRTTSNK